MKNDLNFKSTITLLKHERTLPMHQLRLLLNLWCLWLDLGWPLFVIDLRLFMQVRIVGVNSGFWDFERVDLVLATRLKVGKELRNELVRKLVD
jgi:hypothetical protein